ncbi:protein SIEVE ELEMENT OCCLUSION B-like [Bidens hawaiensis]|uniref:protein SIEVE ELEMENT OCCLUSION B-like n=1 Tax=Bidens hawaiensis TaxID=980011 RepID=UPI00404B4D07
MASLVALRAAGDQYIFSASDDNVIMKNILATHSFDGTTIDVTPLLGFIKDIMHRAYPIVSLSYHGPQVEKDGMPLIVPYIYVNGVNEMLESIALTVNKVGCEISCKCTGGGDTHATTTAIFKSLSSYSWDAKAIVTLASFAVSYGEFWLVTQLRASNPLAESLAQLKHLPDVLERGEFLKPRFNDVTSLVNAILDLTQIIIQFKELPEKYIKPDTPVLVTATTVIPTAVYWIIRSIVTSSSILMSLVGIGSRYVSTTEEAWELSTLTHKISNIYDHLKRQLDLCNKHINEKQLEKAYQDFEKSLETPQLDNSKVLGLIFTWLDGQPPLYDSSTKDRVSIDVFKKKTVLLFITDLNLPSEELAVLEQRYRDSRNDPTRPGSQYEVVWLPVVSDYSTTLWTDENQSKFEELRNKMPWFSLFHPSLLNQAVIRYIKDVWHFNQKPLLVVMDTQGKIVNTNAQHMVWIWGSEGFPFTSEREVTLWRDFTWKIELIVEPVEPKVSKWVAEGKYICLYGGDDTEWIRKFTRAFKNVVDQSGIKLEMLYVGKSNPREKVKKNIEIIEDEELSNVLPSLALIKSFWVRLESMLHSKLQNGKPSDDDSVLKDINVMLTYDGSGKGWAVISQGLDRINNVNGDLLLETIESFESWQKDAVNKGFTNALNDQLEAKKSPHHCNRLILPGTTGNVPEKVGCAECGKPMEKFILYRCCTD